jgi:hypothetical protein
MRRTDTVYDALGRVISQIQPQRSDAQAGIRVVQQYNTAAVVSSETLLRPHGVDDPLARLQPVDLSWSSLANSVRATCKVEMYYSTPSS